MRLNDILVPTPNGLYCPSGDFYVDPRRSVDRAVITHAHADHARAGHRSVIAHPLTLAVIRKRIDSRVKGEALEYGTRVSRNGVTLSLHPAGHVPGSAQVRIEYRGRSVVVTGDYKLEDDGLSEPYEQQRCHWFISECTFGIPLFRWKSQAEALEQIIGIYEMNRAKGYTTVLTAYALGKAQRLLHMLGPRIPEIAVHRNIAAMNHTLEKAGLALPAAATIRAGSIATHTPDRIIIAPSQTLRESWAGQIGPMRVHTVSGWMALPSRRWSINGIALSDHADWPGLNRAVRESGAERITLGHGYVKEFSLSLQREGLPVDLPGENGVNPVSPAGGQQLAFSFL